MALYQKMSPTWNSVRKIKLLRPTSYIFNKNIQVQLSSPYSTCLSYKNLDYCEKWRQPCGSGIARRYLATAPSYDFVKTEIKGEGNKVGVVTIDRPKVLNALNGDVVREIVQALFSFEMDPTIGAIVLTGSEKAFAAGADIKQLAENPGFSEVYNKSMLSEWKGIADIKKPVIAAVNGFALGGGCELAMMCDIIIAGEKARFGQPEINIGTIPGAGGTQRLTHAVGKSRAMQICLTGEMITAQQAESWGLVSSVHPPEKLIDAAVEIGDKIARHSKILSKMAKESVNNAFEMTLQEGLKAEKRIFYSTFSTTDQKEGMKAFIEKRKPSYVDN